MVKLGRTQNTSKKKKKKKAHCMGKRMLDFNSKPSNLMALDKIEPVQDIE